MNIQPSQKASVIQAVQSNKWSFWLYIRETDYPAAREHLIKSLMSADSLKSDIAAQIDALVTEGLIAYVPTEKIVVDDQPVMKYVVTEAGNQWLADYLDHTSEQKAQAAWESFYPGEVAQLAIKLTPAQYELMRHLAQAPKEHNLAFVRFETSASHAAIGSATLIASQRVVSALIEKGLIIQSGARNIRLTDAGLQFCFNKGLIAPTLSTELTDAEAIAFTERVKIAYAEKYGKKETETLSTDLTDAETVANAEQPAPTQPTEHTITVLEALEMTLPQLRALNPRIQGEAVRTVTTLGNGRYFIHLMCGEHLELVPGTTQIIVDKPTRSIPHAIEATIDAYMVAVDPSEVEELIQLQADKEQIALEIQEAEETTPAPILARPNAPVSVGQINAINTLITRHCVGHKREWFTHFTKSVIGRHVASPGKLTASEAQQIEMAIQQIARKRCYPGDLLTADLDLDFTLKFDCFPEDWERAKAEIKEATREAALEVSKMRTSNPRYLTKAEAICYSTKLFKVAETYRKHALETVTVQG